MLFIVTCSGVGSSSDGSSFYTIVSTLGISDRLGAEHSIVMMALIPVDTRSDMTLLVLLTVQLGTQLFCIVHMYMAAPVLHA